MGFLIGLTIIGFLVSDGFAYVNRETFVRLPYSIKTAFNEDRNLASTTNIGTGDKNFTALDSTAPVNGCPDGQTCVRRSLCKDSKSNKGGEGLIDIRFDYDHPQECPHYLEQCCSTDDMTDTSIIKVKPAAGECGIRNADGIGSGIIEARDSGTKYGEFPWMVLIFEAKKFENRTVNTYQCGGSLIHPRVVLTAAHSIQNTAVDMLNIRAGDWNALTKSEPFPHQDRGVAEIAVHEDYNKGSLYNDIALLFLQSPVDIGETVTTVCLPPADTQFDFERCIATGWGTDVFSEAGKYQDTLKKIDLPIVPREDCQTRLRGTRLGQYFELHRSFICAGGEIGKDTCTGDGGSPLVCPIAGSLDQFVQAGIVSWGIRCGGAVPGVYTSASSMRPWLDKQLTYRKIESSFYTPYDSIK